MAVTVALSPFPPIPTVVCQPDQISIGDAATIPFQINRGGAIKERNAKRKNVTYTVVGLTSAQVNALRTEAETNLTGELAGTAPTSYDVTVSGILFEDMYLVDVSTGGSLTIDAFETIPSTTCIFETDRYSLL